LGVGKEGKGFRLQKKKKKAIFSTKKKYSKRGGGEKGKGGRIFQYANGRKGKGSFFLSRREMWNRKRIKKVWSLQESGRILSMMKTGEIFPEGKSWREEKKVKLTISSYSKEYPKEGRGKGGGPSIFLRRGGRRSPHFSLWKGDRNERGGGFFMATRGIRRPMSRKKRSRGKERKKGQKLLTKGKEKKRSASQKIGGRKRRRGEVFPFRGGRKRESRCRGMSEKKECFRMTGK